MKGGDKASGRFDRSRRDQKCRPNLKLPRRSEAARGRYTALYPQRLLPLPFLGTKGQKRDPRQDGQTRRSSPSPMRGIRPRTVFRLHDRKRHPVDDIAVRYKLHGSQRDRLRV